MYQLFTSLLIFVLGVVHLLAGGTVVDDLSHQYLELGTNATLYCPFQSNLYAIFWYDSADHSQIDPVLQFQDGEKSGTGYINGEYDVNLDGSLIINEVSLAHEGLFTCLYFESQSDHVTYFVNVTIIVTPFLIYPVIDKCEGICCFRELEPSTHISCAVRNVRPTIQIAWSERTEQGDEYIINQRTSVKSNPDGTFSTVSTVSKPNMTPLSLLVCKPVPFPGILNYSESVILIQHGNQNQSTYTPSSVVVERYNEMRLRCTDDTYVAYIVWIHHTEDSYGEYAMATFIGKEYQMTTTKTFELDERGYLTVKRVNVEHEGLYSCIYNNGVRDAASYYDVSVYVIPDPPYPLVDGCKKDQYCVIDAHREGTLKCTLLGIRPEIDLNMNTNFQSDSSKITFFDKQLKVKTNEETFDITFTTRYKIEDTSLLRLTLECATSKPRTTSLELSTTFELLLIEEIGPPTESINTTINVSQVLSSSSSAVRIVLPVIILVTLLVCVLISALIFKARRVRGHKSIQDKSNEEQDELKTMLPDVLLGEKYTAQTKVLRSELQATYEPMFQSICPIPFLQEKAFGVKELYVDGGIEHYVTGNLGHKTWIPLSSYQDILKDDLGWSTVRVVEGDPGYGKSILALLLAHDWCRHLFPLENVDIFIFLRLRQLAKTESLFSAIKLLLLPDDTKLSILDIEKQINESSSVLLILDGYDELPNSERPSYVKKILARQMLQNSQVIVTTRSFCFPKEVAPASTRIKLTGFNDDARDQYIRKSVVKDNKNAAEIIKQSLQDNPILADFFQVPFLFVMFSHLTHERNANIKFHSVTSFFQYMLACFHSHHRNKYDNESDRIKSKLFETDHSKLDHMAFEGLLADKNDCQWSKQDVSSICGEEFLEQYLHIGILIEEERLSFHHKSTTASVEPIQRNLIVRFFHKLFCEWYAAYFFAKEVERLSSDNLGTVLKKLDPFYFQYLYRFACGINQTAAEKIIKYLQQIWDGNEFAILCFLEQSGKFENIKDIVTNLCKETILIGTGTSRLLQRSILQLVDIASKVQISVTCIHIEKCFKSVDVGKGRIILNSGLHLPKLMFVEEVKITEMGREFTLEESTDIIHYALNCEKLKRMSLECCMLPAEILDDTIFERLRATGTVVTWNPIVTWYELDIAGKWKYQDNGKIMTIGEYKEEMEQFRESWSDTPWQMSKNGFEKN